MKLATASAGTSHQLNPFSNHRKLATLLAILFPLLFAVLWGVFAVRGDPSRSGKTVVQTPGIIRLLLELGLFGAAAWMMLDLDHSLTALIFGSAVVIHYFILQFFGQQSLEKRIQPLF